MALLKEQCKSSSKVFARWPLAHWVIALPASYHITPHTATGVSPSKMLFGRCLHSRLDLLRLSDHQKAEEKQRQQQNYHDQHSQTINLSEGEKVCLSRTSNMARNGFQAMFVIRKARSLLRLNWGMVAFVIAIRTTYGNISWVVGVKLQRVTRTDWWCAFPKP